METENIPSITFFCHGYDPRNAEKWIVSNRGAWGVVRNSFALDCVRVPWRRYLIALELLYNFNKFFYIELFVPAVLWQAYVRQVGQAMRKCSRVERSRWSRSGG